LIEAGAESMDVLASRIQRIGYRTLRAKTTEEAHQALVDPRLCLGAVVIPPDLPALSLRGALRALRDASSRRDLPFLVTGPRPHFERRRELAQAGATFALFDPVDAHTLRFQVNRALAASAGPWRERRVARAPASWGVELRAERRKKEARAYTVSSRGAFLATPTPFLRNTVIKLMLPVEADLLMLRARVMMTNVPGNLMQKKLPVGMGVRFEEAEPEAEAILQLYAEQRLRKLSV